MRTMKLAHPRLLLRRPLLLSLAGSLLVLLSARPAGAAPAVDAPDQLQLVASAANAFTFARVDSGLQFRLNGVTTRVLFYGPEIVRVNANLGPSHTRQPSLAIVRPPAAVPFQLLDAPDTLRLAGEKLQVLVDKRSGALRFLAADGRELMHEKAAPRIAERMISGAPTYEFNWTFAPAPGESLYGLGQYNRPYMDYRGQEVLLVQTNIGIVVPFLVSTRRYGILWDVYSKMTFKDDASGATFWAESAPAGIDYYFVAGPTMDDVIRGYRELTGAAPMFPKQAFGLVMSKERYQTQAQLLDVARTFRREGFPLDYIVQDWQYWGGADDGTWSGMTWDRQRYPTPAAMTAELHDQLHLKLMVSIWPSIGNDTALAHELDAAGLRFTPLHWISKQARIYDAYSAQGRAIYFKYIKQGLLDVGVDALWMDGTEVEVGTACHDPVGVERDIKSLGSNALGDFTRYLNPYSLLTTQGTYEGQRATGTKRVLTLTRSAWAGQQRYAALPWSGDTTASWETLRNQISGGINVAFAGLPYWTQDTGGFFVNYPEGERNPSYRELYARWNQFGIFNPIYRIHGTNIEREPYRFKTAAPDLYRSLLRAAQLRYELLPYLYSLAWQSTSRGYTMMRGLSMDFPDDLNVRQTDDAFMFGPAFLVHPITRAMYHPSAPPPPTIPVDALRTPDGRPGLAVQYFSGVDFDRPAGATVDERIEHNWPGPPLANPPPGLDGFDDFSARWEGTLTAPETGPYELGVEYDDGARLFLDGKLLVEDWSYGPKRYRGATIALERGQQVKLKAEFHQGKQERYFRLGWRTPGELRALANAKKETDNRYATYLPSGPCWYDFWTNACSAGGQTVSRAYALDEWPLYVRAGSIVPFGPVLQYATQNPEAPYEIRIYAGADGSFTLYEDDNETYRYEHGEFATTELTWHDATRTLTVGARQGAFPGLVRARVMTVVLLAPGASPARHTLHYTGQPAKISFDR